jgi:hypothetical protein
MALKDYSTERLLEELERRGFDYEERLFWAESDLHETERVLSNTLELLRETIIDFAPYIDVDAYIVSLKNRIFGDALKK